MLKFIYQNKLSKGKRVLYLSLGNPGGISKQIKPKAVFLFFKPRL